jgi:hypothetical protein
MKRFRFAEGFVLVGLIMLGMTGPISGGEQVPFSGSMEGLHVSRMPIVPGVFMDVFELSGTATQLGQFDLAIEAVVDFRDTPPNPPMAVGTMTFTAANGDVLVADFEGSSVLVKPGLVLITERAMIDPDSSTGRFAGATGTFTVERLADAATGVTGVTIGSFEGMISSPGAN